jgi:adenine-specific DNA-methyltransferase
MKFSCPEEINFDTGSCERTFESQLDYACDRINGIKNPYIGNKRKILNYIIREIKKEGIKFDSVLDIFSGSASFSMVMKILGKEVISNDILYSSFLYAKCFVENNSYVLNDEDRKYLIHNKNNADGFISQKFINRFTQDEAEELNNFKQNALSIFESDKDDIGYCMAMISIQLFIMDRCFLGGRLNRGQVLADLDHRLNHKRNRGESMNLHKMIWPDFNENDFVISEKSKAYNLDVIEFLDKIKPQADLVYIDPPYGGSQSDYHDMYNFFEEFACPKNRQIDSKKFVNKSDYKNNFVDLLDRLSYLPCWVISYNDSSWESIDVIKKIVKDFKKTVKVTDIGYKYKYRKNPIGKEFLIISY